MREYFVYILTNKSETLYIGVTNNIEERVFEHKEKINPRCFTAKYNLNQLVYHQTFDSIEEAIDREKQLKSWNRQWKIELIESENPYWDDLSLDWYD